MPTGETSADFTQILNDFSRTLSYKIVTKTTDPLTGAETSSFGTADNVSAIFFKEDNRYLFDKEGLLEVGDAYIICPTTQGIKRYDQFTIDSQTYYIENVTRRYVLGTAMSDYASCFMVTA